MACNESRLNIALIGYGKMGQLIESKAKALGHKVIAVKQKNETQGNIQQCDVIIDFSNPSAVLEHIQLATDLKKPLILGTTGWEDQLQTVQNIITAKQGSLLYAPNFSPGVYLFSQIVKVAAKLQKHFPQYEAQGIESHHNKKIDAPSGTAKHLASHFDPKLPFTSLRIGEARGTHTLLFEGPSDCISLTHTAYCRDDFALGALKAAEWIQGKKGIFTMESMFNDEFSCHKHFID